jgi:hypothetical protein
MPSLKEQVRRAVRGARRAGAFWVPPLDFLWQLSSSLGRARLWTRLVHGDELHQITEYTEEDRYPQLFDLAAELRPDAARILSFGCSTGEEIEAVRQRLPEAFIVGAEINPRSRAAARARLAKDDKVRIVRSCREEVLFDIVFALAVLQFRPRQIQERGITDLSRIYPFARFEDEVERLVDLLVPGGLLCVMHAQYRVEDTLASKSLDAVTHSPPPLGPIFGPDERLYVTTPPARSMFVKKHN